MRESQRRNVATATRPRSDTMLSESSKNGELKPAAASESSDSAGEAEMQPELGSSGGAPLPDCQGEPESGEGHSENSAPKVFPARRISLNTAGKPSAAGGEAETAGQASRKRRWGSSTVVTAKKPSISITTDSLKSLIPEVKSSSGSQEAVVELHADEGHLSEDEEGRGEQNLQIRRTVTQVVPADNQENGSKEAEGEEEEEEEQQPGEENSTTCTEDKKESSSGVAMETQSCSPSHEVEAKKVTPSDSLVRRSISQKKSGVSITIDDPVRVAKQPSPPHGKVSNIVHVSNLVRPFTLGQLKELLSRTGTMLEEGFWIDKIKSHCYVTYSNTEEAMSTRTALHGVKWPQSNPKFLRVDFCEQEELDFHRGLLTVDPKAEAAPAPSAAASVTIPAAPSRSSRRASAASPPPPLMQERERPPRPPGDQWAEREREMERRERARAEREWDRGKVRDFAAKHEEEREGRNRRSRSRDRERRRKERGKSKDRKAEKKEKAPEEPPAKLLDDLFRKTKAAPCIYWLPLTDEQVVQKGVERAERMKEREKKRKELLEEEERKREEERAERLKGRERDGVANLRSNEGERGRERDRGRDSYRNRGVESKPRQGGARRSRSRSNPLRRH